MCMELCFATNNGNKIREIKNLLGDEIRLLSLKEIGCEIELPENQTTLEGNSMEKASYVKKHFNINCFADDTGLEVEELRGEPGVFSARYAGPERDNTKNIALLLRKLKGATNRSARFRTVITLILEGGAKQFEGIVKGTITESPSGQEGFGYDPIFIPEGYDKTFAEMTINEKNRLSHRGLAIQKLVEFLNGFNKTK